VDVCVCVKIHAPPVCVYKCMRAHTLSDDVQEIAYAAGIQMEMRERARVMICIRIGSLAVK
jgi:hypothetical protein